MNNFESFFLIITTILICIIIFYCEYYSEKFEKFEKQVVDIVISINAYKSFDFLKDQINNILEYTQDLDTIIILNLNPEMYNICITNEFINSHSNLIINPDNFEKKRFHGSILKGIYSNMNLCFQKYEFKYFIILSSRTFFYRNISIEGIKNIDPLKGIKYAELNKETWFWPQFLRTKIGKYLIEEDLQFAGSAHEGLTLDYMACKKIIEFLQQNNQIKEDLFNYNASVEEFALQSLAINFGVAYDLGNGCYSKSLENSDKNKFVRKIDM